MSTLKPSEQSVLNYINNTWDRYINVNTITSAQIQSDDNMLTKEQIIIALWWLKIKEFIEYTWVQEQLVFTLRSQLSQ